MNNGVLHWHKKWLSHSWWNNFEPPAVSGGIIYYRIPYILDPMPFLTKEVMDDIEKVVNILFKRNSDFSHCVIEMSSIGNKGTTNEYVTACVCTTNKEFYKKYKSLNQVEVE